MQGFSNPFTFTEEFYLFRGPSFTSVDSFTRRDLHVLMDLNPATPEPARPVPQSWFPQLQATDLPLAWTRQHGAGRVFYSNFGHRPETWDNPQFRAHAAAAIRWALFDGDADGLNDAWEQSWGLREYDATGVNGPAGDPDGDGRTNAQELLAGTHPRGFAQRYLAEGATSDFFETRINVLNPNPTFTSRVQLRFQKSDGTVATSQVTLAPLSRRTIIAAGQRGVLDVDRFRPGGRRRSHDDVGRDGPLRQPRGIGTDDAGPQLVFRRGRHRRHGPLLHGAEPR